MYKVVWCEILCKVKIARKIWVGVKSGEKEEQKTQSALVSQ